MEKYSKAKTRFDFFRKLASMEVLDSIESPYDRAMTAKKVMAFNDTRTEDRIKCSYSVELVGGVERVTVYRRG